MDPENSRAGLALPNPQAPSSAPEIELSEVSLHENPLLEKAASSPPCHTWLIFLKRELEFLGFAISGFLPFMAEKKHATYLVWGTLGANTVSSIAAGIGIFILTVNLKRSSVYIYNCQEAYREDFCFMACFSTEIVAMILFLTILGFCSAVSLIIYGVGEVVQGNKIAEDRLYEELNIYSPIYSELEDKVEASSPADS
ncbi:high affinity immunoglobulin epsilon receptor subunit beta isoform X2 [Halichoerus grypus]|uniref:high affinity immunoglobulin epsilon receptor subunit beta-like isoform X2 n=1 Tax=Halichoerus grypus TaxID=9711 RepID=UPI0016595420|nr:high affinity immunoglobulin epsilon receptor subunit beta-like isoform X2 [Halichoerus grypus]